MQRGAIEIGIAEKRIVNLIIFFRKGVDNNRMSIWVITLKETGERLALAIGVGVLFAKIPNQSRVMSESSYQLTAVQFSLDTKATTVKALVIFLLLRDDVQHQAELIHM